MNPTKKKVYEKEKDLKKDTKALLKSVGAKYFMPVPTGFSEGAVDFLVCYKGTFLAIETKVHPRRATALQLHFLNEIREAGGRAVLAYDLEEVHRALQAIDLGQTYYSEGIGEGC